MGQGYLSPGEGRRRHEGAGFNPIRDNDGFGRYKAIYAADGHDRCPGTLNIRPHLGQNLGQSHDFRFAGGITQHGGAFSQYCRHHKVFRAGNGHSIKINFSALQPFGPGFHIAMAYIDDGP